MGSSSLIADFMEDNVQELVIEEEAPFFYSTTNCRVKTLGQFIMENQTDFPYAKGELSRLMLDISIAAKIVNREVNKAGPMDLLGNEEKINFYGEYQQKLDLFANEQFIATSGCLVGRKKDHIYARSIGMPGEIYSFISFPNFVS